MKTKTSELTGQALDWAVSKCEGVDFQSFLWAENQRVLDGRYHYYNYSINWLSAGPIVEREHMILGPTDYGWEAVLERRKCQGDTPIVAAMRCYVLSKLGGEVDIPDVILE